MIRTSGLTMIVIGAIMLVWTGYTFIKNKIIEAGPIQVSADKMLSLNWPPYLGGIVLLGGIILVVSTRKR